MIDENNRFNEESGKGAIRMDIRYDANSQLNINLSHMFDQTHQSNLM